MFIFRTSPVISLGVLILMSSASANDLSVSYPETNRTDQVDKLHGYRVADPYRWLEDDVRESDDVKRWVETQNKVTFGYLEKLPSRTKIKDRLSKLWNYERYSPPFKRGQKYYFFKNDGLQNQDVLFTQDSLDDEPSVLMDPNTWSEDGTVALAGAVFSHEGEYLAYGVSEAGSDWNTWKVMDVASGNATEDKIEWIKFGSPAWTKDGKGFYYSRFKKPEEDQEFQSLNFDQTIYYHELGTDQADDKAIYNRPDHPDWGYGLEVTEDGKFLIVTVWKGTDDKYRILYKDLMQDGSEFVDLIDEFKHDYSFIANNDRTFFFRTDLDAPLGRVIAIDIDDNSPDQWREIIPASRDTLRSVGMVNEQFVAHYLKDAKTDVKIFDTTGHLVRSVQFPGIGTASGFGGKRTYKETFYSFSSFATPPSTYRYDMVTGESTKLRTADVDFNPDDFEVKQNFYQSKDGTRVPIFLAHRKGLKRDGTNPTLLYGYGGFNIPLTPSFSISRLAWMEMGGVFAMPNLRGGGEYGEDWHRAGTKLQKQNVFNDFIAAAEWLIQNKYTSSEKLAIQGGSNGGLLVGACLTQRPDLFGACLPAVGVMDMLRFHKFTAGRYWVDDYGSAENAEEFRALLDYSPYHNLLPGTFYPATLVTTADTDDRVVPGHSFKFAAALQYCQSGRAPVLIRIETRAGHGAGKPTSKMIEEVADRWAFLVQNLGMEPTLP